MPLWFEIALGYYAVTRPLFVYLDSRFSISYKKLEFHRNSLPLCFYSLFLPIEIIGMVFVLPFYTLFYLWDLGEKNRNLAQEKARLKKLSRTDEFAKASGQLSSVGETGQLAVINTETK